jgi:hypothetical protein
MTFSKVSLEGGCVTVLLELNVTERDLIKRILESFLSELRLEIRETKGDKVSLHEEEDLLKNLINKLGNLT